jgi:hypothetical protein
VVVSPSSSTSDCLTVPKDSGYFGRIIMVIKFHPGGFGRHCRRTCSTRLLIQQQMMTVHGISGHDSQTTFFIHTCRLWFMRKTLGHHLPPSRRYITCEPSPRLESRESEGAGIPSSLSRDKKRALKEPPSPPEACTNYHYLIKKRNSLVLRNSRGALRSA